MARIAGRCRCTRVRERLPRLPGCYASASHAATSQTHIACVDMQAPVNVLSMYCRCTQSVVMAMQAHVAVCSHLRCSALATYRQAWLTVLHPDATERAAHFGAALLRGAVVPAFERLLPAYNCKPHMAATREGRALQRLSDFVSALAAANVDCRAALHRKWTSDGAHWLGYLTAAWHSRTVLLQL